LEHDNIVAMIHDNCNLFMGTNKPIEREKREKLSELTTAQFDCAIGKNCNTYM
jgi:hypothetical protein